MRISVIGCGYLGAVHAASMADLGHEVIGIDVDADKIRALKGGKAPFFEPGLDTILESALQSGRLEFSTNIGDAKGARVHFVAVGTPQRRGENAADLTYVDAAVDGLIPYLSDGDLLVGKSTVPVGTAAAIAERMAEAGSGATLAWNPEFLREGFAVQDTIAPDRLVYGVPAAEAGARATALLNEVYATALSRELGFTLRSALVAQFVTLAPEGERG